MRGIPSLITDIRKKVFTEVACMAYSGNGYEGAEDLPFRIVPGDQPMHRESIFLERDIAGERVRLAMGLSIRPIQTRSLMTEGMDAAAIAEQYYEPPLINIIPYACHACPTNQYRVTENCQNCLAASCQKVCPKGAVSFVNGKSHIDPEKCIKCGKCANACPYHAIIHMERPCQAACGMDAIVSDEHGRAKIDQDKCVACGRCVEVCPAGAAKLGQKLCSKKAGGQVPEYPRQELPDATKWDHTKWSPNYRNDNRIETHESGTAPCKTACPAHVAVQGYLKLAAQGRYDEALALIKRENPLPAICGRVCNRRCEDACTRGRVDAAVLGQSFFFSPEEVEHSSLTDDEFMSAASLVYLDRDLMTTDAEMCRERLANADRRDFFKSMFSSDECAELLSACQIYPGVEDDRYPLDRNVLIKEIEAVRTVRDSQSTPSEEDQTTFTPGYILHNLPAVAMLLVRSVVQDADNWVRGLVGGSLSYSSLDLAWFWVLALYLLLWYAAVPAQDVPVPGLPQGRYRVWCALAALLCAALAFAGCLVWTPTYYQTVYGFQGRYLLPVLPLLLLTCLPRRVQVASGKQSACTLVCCLCVVNAGVLLNAMLAVIAR